MTKQRICAAVAVVLSFGVASCNQNKTEPAPIRPVLTMALSRDPATAGGIVGSVQPQVKTDLSFRTVGRLIARPSNVGDTVGRGDVVAVHSLRRGAAEALEAIAHGDPKSSKVVGKRIEQIDLPRGATIGAIVRSAEGGPLERLQLSFETWIRHLAERPNLFRIILRQMSGEEGPSGVETLAWNAGLSLQQELLDEAKLAYKRPNLTIDQLNAAACGPTFVFLAIAFNRPDFDSADPAFQAQLDQHIDEIKATLQRLLAA